jgi:hypothetical protein
MRILNRPLSTSEANSCHNCRFLVTDPINVLCLCPYWLANVSQLTKLQSQELRDTLRLAVYCQSVRFGDKPLETHEQNLYFQSEYL